MNITLAAVVILLQLADAYTTVNGLRQGHVELNPVLLFFKDQLPGWWWLAVPKILGIGLIAFIGSYEDSFSTFLLCGLTFWYGWVLYQNVQALK